MEKKSRDEKLEKGLYQCGLLMILAGLAAGFVFGVCPQAFPKLPCLFHKFTGYYCPGCGGTRAVKALLAGHIGRSFFYHPAVPCAGALFLWYMFSHTIEYLSKGRLRIGLPYRDGYMYVLFGIILVQWILKNGAKALWGVGI